MQRLYKRIGAWCRTILDVLGLRSQPIQLRRIPMPGKMKKKTKKAKKQAATAMSMKKAGKKPKGKMKY